MVSIVLIVTTSFAFLLPARVSFSIGWLWQAAVFIIMTIVCFFYHVCDAHVPALLGLGFTCPEPTRYFFTLADHGLAYFCVLQMAFLVLGPEDPAMQWIDHASVQTSPGFALSMATPPDVIMLTRLLPAAAMSAFLCLFTSWDDFHWQSLLVCDVLVIVACTAFWLNPDRRSSILKVLMRNKFWQRAWRCGGMPVLFMAVLFTAMQFFHSRALHAMWHVAVAIIAVNIIGAVSWGSTAEAQSEGIMDLSPRNPVIVRSLLGLASLFGLSTLLTSLVLDRVAVGHFRWPMVSMPTLQRPGGYLVAIGILPTLVALTVSFCLIRSTATTAQPAVEPEACTTANGAEIVVGKHLGCSVGHWSVLFGLLAVAAHGSVFPTIHLVCLIACIGLLQVAMVLTSLSAPYSSWRSVFTVLGCLAMSTFLTLLLLAKGFIPNAYSVPHILLACAEYAALALPTLWPLCWSSEVHSRWHSTKGWHNIWSNHVPHIA